jgi:hypothetical protein
MLQVDDRMAASRRDGEEAAEGNSSHWRYLKFPPQIVLLPVP